MKISYHPAPLGDVTLQQHRDGRRSECRDLKIFVRAESEGTRTCALAQTPRSSLLGMSLPQHRLFSISITTQSVREEGGLPRGVISTHPDLERQEVNEPSNSGDMIKTVSMWISAGDLRHKHLQESVLIQVKVRPHMRARTHTHTHTPSLTSQVLHTLVSYLSPPA